MMMKNSVQWKFRITHNWTAETCAIFFEQLKNRWPISPSSFRGKPWDQLPWSATSRPACSLNYILCCTIFKVTTGVLESALSFYVLKFHRFSWQIISFITFRRLMYKVPYWNCASFLIMKILAHHIMTCVPRKWDAVSDHCACNFLWEIRCCFQS